MEHKTLLVYGSEQVIQENTAREEELKDPTIIPPWYTQKCALPVSSMNVKANHIHSPP